MLAIRTIFRLWFPLAVALLAMKLEGPIMQALLARMPEAVLNLACFGTCYGFLCLAEAPVYGLISASNALVSNKTTYRYLRNFTWAVGGGISGLLLLLQIPAVLSFFTQSVFQLPNDLPERFREGMLMAVPSPLVVAIRRFYQGILVRHSQSNRVFWGSMMRLFALSSCGLLLLQWTDLLPSSAAMLALSAGVSVEALFAYCNARRFVGTLCVTTPEKGATLSLQAIARFYAPLASLAIVSMAIEPLVMALLSRGTFALESLAVFLIARDAALTLSMLGMAFQETCVAQLSSGRSGMLELRRFRDLLLVFLVAINTTLLIPKVQSFVFIDAWGLDNQLATLLVDNLWLLLGVAPLSVLIFWHSAILMARRRTFPLTLAALADVLATLLTCLLLLHFSKGSALSSGLAACLCGQLAAFGVLYSAHKRIDLKAPS